MGNLGMFGGVVPPPPPPTPTPGIGSGGWGDGVRHRDDKEVKEERERWEKLRYADDEEILLLIAQFIAEKNNKN